MYSINEISLEHIKRLSDLQLSQVLHTLLFNEASQRLLQDYSISVPLKITVADGGEDGRIEWVGNPATTNWLKNKLCVFQNKATILGPKDCYEEILEPSKTGKKRKLKSQILELIEKEGCYILFTNQDLNILQIKKRMNEFRRAIKDSGHANYLEVEIKIYDANKIKDWTNEYIAAVSLVQKYNGIERLLGCKIYDEWKTKKEFISNPYQTDKKIGDNLIIIKKTIEERKVFRLNGHSGLGKTRLILEAFRTSDLNKSLLYYDLKGSEDISVLKKFINNYQEHQNGILVIDNCGVKNHNILSDIVNEYEGGIRVITIGLDDNNAIEDFKIKLDRNNQRDIVKEIIQEKIGTTHQPSDIEYINIISEGYPWMAIRFCDVVIKEGMVELNKIPIDEFIKKLIFGLSPEDEIEYDVIRACSVFSAFGFLDDSFTDVINDDLKKSLKAQMDFIRTRVYDGHINETKFREICNKFLNDDIIERRGTYYIVKPTILAINLASNWLIHTGSDRIVGIIQELKLVKLDEKFVDRLKDLDQIDKAKDIVADLWGPNRPFSTAEVLNTSWGSLLFRYVVEVNPIKTAQALDASFARMNKTEVSGIDNGRRNLVWALEKLCFRNQTFDIATKILYSFAVSENETWSNNATHQFIQLFQLFLSGTQASLNKRLDIIKWGLNKNDSDYTRIAIQAMEKGLMNHHYTRMGGAEKQGSSAPLHDYHPKWPEISEYWKEIISILTELSCSDDPLSIFAQDAIANSIRSLLNVYEIGIVIDSIQRVIQIKGNLWIAALNNLKMTLNFEKHLTVEMVEKIQFLIKQLTPTDVKNQLLLRVTKPEWESYEKDEEDFYIDKPKRNAEVFAQQLVEENINWMEYIHDLLHDEQRQAFNFGNKIGELITEKHELITIIINELRSIKKENQNPELLAGILHGSQDINLIRKTIDLLIPDDVLQHHIFYLTRVLNLNSEDIEKLFILIDKYGYSINQFQIFQYGRALDTLENEKVILLCERISEYGNAGKWTALSLLYMFSYKNENKWEKGKGFFKNLIHNNNMIIEKNAGFNSGSYYWSDVVSKILKQGNDRKFAIVIAKQIISFCAQKNFNYSSESYVSNVIIDLFDYYFEDIWEYFGEAITSDYLTFSHIKTIIGKRIGLSNDLPGKVFENKHRCNIILEWSKNASSKASERIANMMPLGMVVNGKTKWHQFSKAMIDEFGDNQKFLDQLHANMGTFSSTGSLVPYYTTQKELFSELIDHKIELVRKWAHKGITYIDKKIKQEKLNDEEDSLD